MRTSPNTPNSSEQPSYLERLQQLIVEIEMFCGNDDPTVSDIPPFLQTLPPSQDKSYILMERIHPLIHPSKLVIEKQLSELACISEIGRYGVCLANDTKILRNEDAGYLVRTKAAEQDEGGVCAGYACLNSICLD